MEEEEVPLTAAKGKRRWLWMLVGTFLFIFLFLFYTSFVNPDFGQPITGNAIKGDISSGVSVQVDLNAPDSFKASGRMDKIDMKVNGAFYVDDKLYDLDSASIVIDNFDGEVSFDDKNVVVEGKTNKIFIEGIPISGKIEVNFDNRYSYLKLGNFYLSSFSYEASGIVRLQNDKVAVNLDDEIFKVKKFNGDLEKRGKRFKLSGFAQEASAGLITVKASDEISNEE